MGASFLVAAVATGLCVAGGTGTIAQLGCQVVGFVIPVVFTHRYPEIVRNRHADDAAPAAGTAAAL